VWLTAPHRPHGADLTVRVTGLTGGYVCVGRTYSFPSVNCEINFGEGRVSIATNDTAWLTPTPVVLYFQRVGWGAANITVTHGYEAVVPVSPSLIPLLHPGVPHHGWVRRLADDTDSIRWMRHSWNGGVQQRELVFVSPKDCGA
jgi:hypothetical protein